ncbi:MAG: TlpA family protein disulfide reductase [Planctomycetes bacterium]|nr:TlpA family protein disulfide reductase [Planctomycetota bacterium]
MKARVWLAGAALIGATLAYAPTWITQAQDSGDKPAKEEPKAESEYSSAKEVMMSLAELTKDFKNPRNPSPEEIDAFFAGAFPRCADYLDANKDATDRDTIYNWAGRRGQYGYGQPAFVRIADSYLADHKDADDVKDWNDAKLFARLGIKDQSEAAQKDLKKLEEEAHDDASRRLELADIWLRHYDKSENKEAKDKLIEKLKGDETFAKSEDEWVKRRFMRTIFANSTVEEIKMGEAFPDWAKVMTVNALDGKPISLADYKGKVVLIDFWATWCGPCMHEMPNVIKLYNEMHEKGFEVIGISLDGESGLDKLKTTIAGKENVEAMPWRQIYDGGGWSTGLAMHYGIHSIPRPVLIDQEGKVAGDKLRGEELAAKVKELLSNNEDGEDDMDGADK